MAGHDLHPTIYHAGGPEFVLPPKLTATMFCLIFLFPSFFFFYCFVYFLWSNSWGPWGRWGMIWDDVWNQQFLFSININIGHFCWKYRLVSAKGMFGSRFQTIVFSIFKKKKSVFCKNVLLRVFDLQFSN